MKFKVLCATKFDKVCVPFVYQCFTIYSGCYRFGVLFEFIRVHIVVCVL